jgi:hypothetical protein
MKPSRMICGAVLFAILIAACVSNESSQAPDESSQVRSEDTAEVNSLRSEPEPRACFIEGFCGPPRFCIHTGPCGPFEAFDLALTFCRNHCNPNNCGTIIQLPACP